MNPIEYKITLDCRRAESQVTITAKQGEASGRKITFSLNEGRLPYKVPSGVTAVLRAKKPSGAVLYNTCTVTADGNVEYIITTQTVAEVGKLPCELQLSQDGKVIFSPNFTLLVYKNLSVDSEVESSDEFTALQAAINKAENLTDGTTFTPSVSEDGVLSWTNDGGKNNPEPVNIKGEDGTFRINVTYSNGVYSADKTFDEIKAAYNAGQQPYVVETGGTFDLVYTLANFDAPTDGSEPKFVDFKRYLVGDGILETEMLRIYSYTTDSGSNVVKRIDEFKMPTSLKNPNALTFTGGATGSYDGSEPETVHIPVIPYEVINKNTAARHSHDNKTVLDGITAEKVTKWDDNAAGATFTPSVSADGTLSWTNDKGLTNPDPVNIKGPAGADGATGATGAAGAPGVYYGTTPPTGDTHPVWIDPDGDHDDGGLLPAVTAADNGKVLRVVSSAWAAEDMPTGGTDIGITGATVGQIAKITAVDASGVPTAWSPVDMPDKLPNPNALTFTGAVTGSYDGSAPLSVEIPSGGGSSGGSTAEWQLLGTYTMLVSDRSLVIDLSQFGGVTHFRIIGNFPKCSEDCGPTYIYLGTAFNHMNQPSQKQNVYAFNLLAECELVDRQLYGFIGTIDGWTQKPIASVAINSPRDSVKCTSFKIYYANAVNDTTENIIRIWGY